MPNITKIKPSKITKAEIILLLVARFKISFRSESAISDQAPKIMNKRPNMHKKMFEVVNRYLLQVANFEGPFVSELLAFRDVMLCYFYDLLQ